MTHTHLEIQEDVSVIEVYSSGIQGPKGDSGSTGSIRQLSDVDLDNVVPDDSILIYNATADKWENALVIDGGAP